MACNPVNTCNAFIYFLFMTFAEGDYQEFRDKLERRDESVALPLQFLDSFIQNFADSSFGKELESDDYIIKLKLDIFKKNEPRPIELEIQV